MLAEGILPAAQARHGLDLKACRIAYVRHLRELEKSPFQRMPSLLPAMLKGRWLLLGGTNSIAEPDDRPVEAIRLRGVSGVPRPQDIA